MALPIPRHLLTSLINTLTSYSPTLPESQPVNPTAHTVNIIDTTNVLKSLPASHRALLTTLHVIIPPPTLLQALDLLDRRLVTRISYTSPSQNEGQGQAQISRDQGEVVVQLGSENAQSQDHRGSEVVEAKKKQKGFYLVKSSQPPKGRFKTRDDRASFGTTYIVRVEAWNCSCAAFAFSAFPSFGTSRAGDGIKTEKEHDGDDWEYGGESLDGRCRDSGVPVCKHLLACLLGERWGSVLGGFVGERVVDREEVAGLSAG